MSTVRDMIRKKGSEIFSVSPDATVHEALSLMAKHNTGALMVVSGKKIDGIISERDCVRKLDLANRSARTAKVSEIMTSKLISVEAGQP
ncbi:MAG: CBS domain-containing protein, partial [Chloroflexi bacterium]|nr:CBS domain-containing protein [Chloroflexota bacterium]